MIDLHCHILPKVDDGPKTIIESVEMAELAVEQGITHIVATPHHQNGQYINERAKLEQPLKRLEKELLNKNIPLSLSVSQEIRIHGNLLADIKNGKIKFIDDASRYLLIEFPTTFIPGYSEQLFSQLLEQRYCPIIVHPERNHVFAEQPSKLLRLVQQGALCQLTAGSILGMFGKKTEKVSHQFIEANLIHLLASDAHNTTTRGFNLAAAYAAVEQKYGELVATRFQQASYDILNGQPLKTPKPLKVKRKKWFW